MRTIYHIAPKRSGHGWVSHMMRSWVPGVPLADLENWSPHKVRQTFSSAELHRGIVVVQTRDLLNWYASYTGGGPPNSYGVIQSWYDITQEFYEPKLFSSYYVVNIHYDKFFADRRYRQVICNAIGGDYSEKKLQTMSHGGGGSTFSQLEYDNNAQAMQVLTRYKQVPAHIYRGLFQNKKHLLDFYLKNTEDQEKIDFVKSMQKDNV